GNWWEPQMVTGVAGKRSGVSQEFSLAQNYPNPFNPVTEIRLMIGDWGLVSLRIYDVLGREVATIVNENKAPGAYAVPWDARNIPSGVYFYRLTAGNFTGVKQMLLIR